ncbi:MAG: diguanylate cyclase (GGDEF)-like protein [Granulosicoccus sp.]|jgi:diguanylate cyclase (GGDEF)-like protein
MSSEHVSGADTVDGRQERSLADIKFLRDQNFLDLRHELIQMSHSRTARMLAGSVALVLFTIQWFVFLSGLYSDYHLSIDRHMTAKQAAVSSFIVEQQRPLTEIPTSIFDDSLVGLVIFSDSDMILLDEGNTLGFDIGIQSLTNRGFVHPNRWNIETPSKSLTAIAFVDTQTDVADTAIQALKLLVLSLFTCFLAGAIAMLFTFRFYTLPMERLIESLRDSREQGESEVPESIKIPENVDLQPLAREINKLIDGQRKSARLVKVKQQYLEFAAHHDPLTHLPNRLMFEDALNQTVHRAINEDRQFTVYLVDLDNFKHFNDQYGHLIGDKMVTEVANRLRTQISGVDVVARLDGDEFVVLQRDSCEVSSTEKIAERILSVIAEPYEHLGFTLKVAVSIGIARFPDHVLVSQEDELLGEEIVSNATVALQEAKDNGKGQFQLFTEKMRSDLTNRIRIERDLKIALQENQFEVFYQPKINIHTKQCTGAEALVRWNHPENGFVSPEDFVPIAEETGMIIELGEWVLRNACTKMRDLQALGYTSLTVAVNISAVQFTDGNLLPMISKALRDTEINPETLELEITESAVMNDPAEVIRSLHQLSEHGLKLAIDDFGTGYSSLAYLKKFPVDTLKIDKAFITDVSSDNDDVAIVEAVLALGKHFNMKVVAEGIEDEAQLEFLKSQGCDIAQGYFISKPLNADQYTEWLQRWPYGVQGAVTKDSISSEILDQPRTGTEG